MTTPPAPTDPRAWRRAHRRRLIAERLAMSEADYERFCAAVTQAVLARVPVSALGLVGGYWPIRREYDCRPLLAAVIEAGGAVALPVVVGAGQPLDFRGWTPDAAMDPGPWDTLHPLGPPLRPDTLLIPLVGFDSEGHRLGYGGGFYDRTLASMTPRPMTIGVGFEQSRLATIGPQSHDLAMDYVFTEAGMVLGA